MKSVLLLALAVMSLHAEDVTRLKADEQILLYPSIAYRVGTNQWHTEVLGCVFEPENRRLLLAALREALGLADIEMSTTEKQIFDEHARLFLVDHERGKKVFIRLGGKVIALGKSEADGTFSGEVTFTTDASKTDSMLADGHLSYEVALPAKDNRSFRGSIFLLEDEGVSVISDIDDTIKITQVQNHEATLRNTFLHRFEPVPGMTEFYQSLARSNTAAFHYISASPWQLYEPLAAFISSNGFPAGTFDLKPFRWKDRSFFNLFADPVKYKLSVIEPLLKEFPNRRFILIGDSGERDPEIYGALAKKFPEQIMRIHIRDVTNETADAPRYREAFRTVPRHRWFVFREPPAAL